MKRLLHFRLVWLALLLSATLVTACKKDNVVPQPTDLSDRVAGTYTYSELSSNGQTLPADETNLRGTVTISRQTATTVRIAFAISLRNGNPFLNDVLNDVTVRENGNAFTYEYSGQTFAQGKANQFVVNGRDTANNPFTLTATK
ncbi:hypothetical protein GGR92_002195 [Spirosoma lacussanchae]|uniref:hypothetical protein n=1 Tax=Spirosoma lacussanchae TaxID=1884249 RepID=UPI001108009C|nr:hypothetical protein [Spirosoma lacussanchae]